MRPLIALSLSLVFLPALASSARADLVLETEPNNTLETANKTIGTDDLGFAGSLTLGDIDTLSLFITPNDQQEAFFAFDVYWSEGETIPYQNWHPKRWLVARLPVDDFYAQVGLEYNEATFFFGVSPSPPQVYYLQLFSTLSEPDPFTSASVSGSTLAGNYRLTNIRGLNGSVVTGTAVPEPSSILLGLALAGSGLWIRRCKKGEPRREKGKAFSDGLNLSDLKE